MDAAGAAPYDDNRLNDEHPHPPYDDDDAGSRKKQRLCITPPDEEDDAYSDDEQETPSADGASYEVPPVDDESPDEEDEGVQPVSYQPSNSSASTSARSNAISLDPRYAPPRTRLADLIGHAAVKLRLEEVLLPLALPLALVRRVYQGIRSHGNGGTALLLYGPPGCGKTQLAQALAGEAGAAYLAMAPSDVLSKFVGASERAVRYIFEQARAAAAAVPSRTAVLFWDEIDALGVARGSGSESGDPGSRRLLAELLLQFNRLGEETATVEASSSHPQDTDDDAYKSSPDSSRIIVTSDPTAEQAHTDVLPPRVIVLAATNRPEDCDPALLRRFGLRLYVGYPTVRDRARLIRKHLREIDHSLVASDWAALATATEGWSGSDLQHWVREASMAPVRECLQAAARQRRQSQRGQTDDTEDWMVDDDEEDEYSHSSNNDHHEDDNGLQAARAALVTSLESLRPVSRDDMYTALDFCLGQAVAPADAQALVSPPSSTMSGPHATHYESASSDDG
jgi:SpoVK/Ycf46/Vps4 family AAA+-type ATPase